MVITNLLQVFFKLYQLTFEQLLLSMAYKKICPFASYLCFSPPSRVYIIFNIVWSVCLLGFSKYNLVSNHSLVCSVVPLSVWSEVLDHGGLFDS